MLCSGKSSEFCGGPNRLNVYNYTGTDLGTGGGGGGGSPLGPFPVLSGLPTGWAYNACWVYVIFSIFFCFDIVFLICSISVTMLMGGSLLPNCLEARLIPSSLVLLDALPTVLRLLVPNSLVSRKESPVEIIQS